MSCNPLITHKHALSKHILHCFMIRTSGPGVVIFRLIKGDGGDLGPCFGSDRGSPDFPNLGEFILCLGFISYLIVVYLYVVHLFYVSL